MMPRSGRCVAWLLALAAVAARAGQTQTLEPENLDDDDECAANSALCSVSLRQLRGHVNLSEAEDNEGPSCAQFGCQGYRRGQACQCNPSCHQHGNCCRDYDNHCVHRGHREHSGSCQQYGCGQSYIAHQTCQCNSKCAGHGNCCWDYKQRCSASHGGSPHQPGHLYGHPSGPASSYPQYPGFTLWLAEDFDQPLSLDSDPIWTWSDGGLAEGQVRFVKEQIKFEGGKMKIVADHNRGIKTQSCSMAEAGHVDPKPLVSGEFRSRSNIFRYGRYEVRLKAPAIHGDPAVNGNFVSTMFIFRDGKFRHWREIDIEITGNSPGSVTTNLLNADHTKEWRQGIQSEEDHHLGGNARSEFHTYAFEWLPNRVSWFVNGRKIREVHSGHHKIPTLSAKFIMNLWIFGPKANFGGKHINNNQYPMVAEYDWIRFYKWDGDQHYPCAGMTDGCLSSDDQYLSANNPCDGKAQVGTIDGAAVCQASCR